MQSYHSSRSNVNDEPNIEGEAEPAVHNIDKKGKEFRCGVEGKLEGSDIFWVRE